MATAWRVGGEDVSLTTGASTLTRGNFADGARYRSAASFVQDEIDVSPRLHLNLGTRYSSFHPHALVTDPSTGPLLIDSRQRALTGSAHALFRLTSGVEVVGGVAQGFRAPNIDDLTILGRTGSRFEVPNPTLEPESSLNLEAGMRGRSVAFSAAGTYFLTDIDGLIQRELGTFEGETFRDLDGDGVKSASEPLIFQRQNAGRARIQGIELEAQVHLAAQWTLSGTVTRTVGTEQITGDPLRRIPPTYGRAVLDGRRGRLRADLYSRVCLTSDPPGAGRSDRCPHPRRRDAGLCHHQYARRIDHQPGAPSHARRRKPDQSDLPHARIGDRCPWHQRRLRHRLDVLMARTPLQDSAVSRRCDPDHHRDTRRLCRLLAAAQPAHPNSRPSSSWKRR